MKTTPTQSQKQLNNNRTSREVQGKSFIEQDVETSTFSMEDQVIMQKKDLVQLSHLWQYNSAVFSPETEKERKKGEIILVAGDDTLTTLTQTLIHNYVVDEISTSQRQVGGPEAGSQSVWSMTWTWYNHSKPRKSGKNPFHRQADKPWGGHHGQDLGFQRREEDEVWSGQSRHSFLWSPRNPTCSVQRGHRVTGSGREWGESRTISCCSEPYDGARTAHVLLLRTLWTTWHPGEWPQKEEHVQRPCAIFPRGARQAGCHHPAGGQGSEVSSDSCPLWTSPLSPLLACVAEQKLLCSKKDITSMLVMINLFLTENLSVHCFTSILAATASGGALYLASDSLYSRSGK